MLKPEEVPKKINVLEATRPEDRQMVVVFFVFFGTSSGFGNICCAFFGTSSGFGNKIVPKPEEVPKKSKLCCQNLRRYQKKKDFHVLEAPGPEDRQVFVFLFFVVPPQVLAIFLGFLVPPQDLAIKSCQNLRRYKKKKQNFFANT